MSAKDAVRAREDAKRPLTVALNVTTTVSVHDKVKTKEERFVIEPEVPPEVREFDEVEMETDGI